jgi:hypothetical protein
MYSVRSIFIYLYIYYIYNMYVVYSQYMYATYVYTINVSISKNTPATQITPLFIVWRLVKPVLDKSKPSVYLMLS